jgi:rare lipoprotein A
VIGASDYRLLKDQTWTSPAPLAVDALSIPAPSSAQNIQLPEERDDKAFSTRASWYGPGFQGRRTASGVVFNQYGLTAASRTLPLGSKVLVANPTTGRCCTVLINDRGPYVNGRDIDLSRGAAAKIGVTGVSPVVCVAYTKDPVSAKGNSRSARRSRRSQQRLASENSKYTTIAPPEQINDRPMRLMAGMP